MTIASLWVLLRIMHHSSAQVADRLQAAVDKALDDGYRTKDIWSEGKKLSKCSEVGEVLLKYVSA